MKKLPFKPILLMFIGLAILLTSCGEGDTPNELLPVTESSRMGFLCTIGLSRTGASDTLVYTHRSIGTQMQGYLKGMNEDNERIILTPYAGGIWSLTRTVPVKGGSGEDYVYFGFDETSIYDGYPPGYDYAYQLSIDFTADCEFILTKHEVEPDLFYLESKLYPGYYLSPEKWKEASYPTETDLVLGNVKQAFFIMQR